MADKKISTDNDHKIINTSMTKHFTTSSKADLESTNRHYRKASVGNDRNFSLKNIDDPDFNTKVYTNTCSKLHGEHIITNEP